MKDTLYAALLALLWFFPPMSAAQVCNANILETTPSERFTIHGDGTVTDSRTGLMWKQCPEGQSGDDCVSGSAITYEWQQALEQAAMATNASYTDWRLPNIKELDSIVEMKCYDPAINLSVFPNTPSIGFWSSSADANYSDYAWVVNFYYGGDNGNYRSNNNAVRLVRGGQ